MGCLCPSTDETTANIDREIRGDQTEDEKTIKLLFLGAGGSGKSTLFKQLRLLYGDGLSEDLRKGYTKNIYHNIVIGIKTLLEGNLEMTDDNNDEKIKLGGKIKRCDEKLIRLIQEIADDDTISPQTAKVIQMAWADPGLRMTWENRSQLQVQESLGFFVANLKRISAPDYIPNNDDLLNVRAVTTGIVEEDMKIENTNFHIVDVGGQRSERRKWIRCFDDVTGLIFVVSLIAYNQVLYEDEQTNRMKEALDLFKKTLTGDRGDNFKNACVVLFLNKDDLFKEMIKNYPITKCFPEYKGKLTELDQFNYIKQKYEDIVAPRKIFVHRTWATNTEQIEVIFNLVNYAILRKAIAAVGMLIP